MSLLLFTAALRIACSAHSLRTTVDYVIYKLVKRVNNPSWLVALKALMTFHRLLRECDASFAEQVRWQQQQQGQGGCAGSNSSKGRVGALGATAARAGWVRWQQQQPGQGGCAGRNSSKGRVAGSREGPSKTCRQGST